MTDTQEKEAPGGMDHPGQVCLSMKNQHTQSVKHRLVEQIDQQGILSEKIEERELPAPEQLFIPAKLAGDTEQEVACQEQKEPGQQRKIVRREECGRGKSQKSGQIVAVQECGKPGNDKALKTQRAAASVAQQEEQGEAECGTHLGGNLFQKLFQRNQQ